MLARHSENLFLASIGFVNSTMMIAGRDIIAGVKIESLRNTYGGCISIAQTSLGGRASTVGFAAYIRQSSILRSR